MPKKYWLVKSEPESYSWTDFVKEGKAAWTGVRNYQARNHLRAMNQGDTVCFYHSVSEKQIVGLAEVARAAYPDPTATEGDWSAVDLVPLQPLPHPVSLETIKADRVLQNLPLVKNSRLSVSPVSAAQFDRLMEMGGSKKKN